MEHKIVCDLILHAIIIILLLIIICRKAPEYMATAQGGYLNSYLKNSGYVGQPLIDSVDDSGADLRILGTQFSSTDQGERFKNMSQFYR